MRLKRRTYKQWGRKAKKIALILLIGMLMGFLTDSFFDTYSFRAPVVKREISPLPDSVSPSVINNMEPDIENVPTATPTAKPKKRVSGGVIAPVYAADIDQSTDEQIIEYIKSKDWDDDIAVALAKSENFWNLTKSFDCGRTGKPNKNGTVDRGIFQINSIHINSGAITLEDTLDCYKNIDYAYGLYKGRGNWSAWSAYNNGSYLNHL